MWHCLLGFDLFETIGLLRLHRRNVRLGLWFGVRLVLVLALQEVVLLGVKLETFQLRIECCQRVARHQVHHCIDGLVEVSHGEVGLAACGLHFALHRLALRLGTLAQQVAHLRGCLCGLYIPLPRPNSRQEFLLRLQVLASFQ